jgi:hypothetical protein
MEINLNDVDPERYVFGLAAESNFDISVGFKAGPSFHNI